METDSEHDNELESRQGGSVEPEVFDAQEFVVPGVPIVRSNTPKPLSFGLQLTHNGPAQRTQPSEEQTTLSAFPVEAPSAPPLPEETGGSEDSTMTIVEATPLPLPSKPEPSEHASLEFVWLFEYGLEMDPAVLNSSERLDGLASLYGPAVLKGYCITFDVLTWHTSQVVATILPSSERGAEVWGVLYRVPRRITERQNAEPPLLDKIHRGAPPDGIFERLQVTVHEVYREREVTCITYMAASTARQQFHVVPHEIQDAEKKYAQRLLETATKQKLPSDYLQELAQYTAPNEGMHPEPTEQNTEPLPVIPEESITPAPAHTVQETPAPPIFHPGMIVFAFYIVLLLFAVLALVILQGLGIGRAIFTTNFTPLGVPWFVLVYGLMGGCVSCIVTLGRQHSTIPPHFVLVTWFTRPFIGVVLALLMYLLLNSGIFVLGGSERQHDILFSLLGFLAGSCEGWLFYRSHTSTHNHHDSSL